MVRLDLVVTKLERLLAQERGKWPMSSKDLNNHVFLAYTSLRCGMGILGLLLPLVLMFGGLASRTPFQASLSDYYNTPMRDYFVGILFALGSFLYLYKGFSWKENYALNIAGVLVILIAVVPTDVDSEPPTPLSPTAQFHHVFAILFLLTIAYVCLFRSADTLGLLELMTSKTRANFYYYTYKLIGICMATAPFVVLYIEHRYRRVFFTETTTVWIFSAYWLLKTKEMVESRADQWVALTRHSKEDLMPGGKANGDPRDMCSEPDIASRPATESRGFEK
jgi:hypothetical protein